MPVGIFDLTYQYSRIWTTRCPYQGIFQHSETHWITLNHTTSSALVKEERAGAALRSNLHESSSGKNFLAPLRHMCAQVTTQTFLSVQKTYFNFSNHLTSNKYFFQRIMFDLKKVYCSVSTRMEEADWLGHTKPLGLSSLLHPAVFMRWRGDDAGGNNLSKLHQAFPFAEQSAPPSINFL